MCLMHLSGLVNSCVKRKKEKNSNGIITLITLQECSFSSDSCYIKDTVYNLNMYVYSLKKETGFYSFLVNVHVSIILYWYPAFWVFI